MSLKKIKLKVMAIASVLIAALASCTQDYGVDYKELAQKVDDLTSEVNDLRTAITDGLVIKSVEPVEGGIEITLSDDRKFTIVNGRDGIDGTNGENGQDGKDGTVWKIGDNGNWWSSTDGEPFVDTEKPARGPQGLPGINGTNGTNGADGQDGEDGKNGDYFYPCVDKTSANYGKWIKVNGETGEQTPTNDEWLPKGTVTAVWADDTLTIHNVEGAENGVVNINITRVLKSLAVIPEQLMFGFQYPIADAYEILILTFHSYFLNRRTIDVTNVTSDIQNAGVRIALPLDIDWLVL
jgi:hypothetical protein